MGGDSKSFGGQPPHSAAHLQPDDRALTLHASEETALAELHQNGFDRAERADADQAATHLARLMGDHMLVEQLRQTGFAGPKYEVFKATLAAYGYPVMRAWIRRRQIYRLTADRGRPVTCTDDIREHLADDADDRQELAMDVVANALVFFREHALVNGKWTAEGGASLTTFFAGACVAVFPNIFRAWLKEYKIDRDTDRYELAPDPARSDWRPLDLRDDGDPAEAVCGADTFRRALEAANSERLRAAIAAVVLADAQYVEIAEQEGTTESAIKQMIYRYRKSARRPCDDGRQQ